jgi:hypothetical protein
MDWQISSRAFGADSLPFKGRVRVGMGKVCEPIPLPASPLKGEEWNGALPKKWGRIQDIYSDLFQCSFSRSVW